MAETQTTSLDQTMQSYIDSGRYSESELAEIRKREANKLKESTRETSWWRGEEGLIPDELQPGVSRPRVNKKVEEKAIKVTQPKKKKKSYIPNANELEEMTDGSVFFVEKNLTQNLNKHFNKIGENRYTVVEDVAGMDAIKVFDTKTLTYSPTIYVPGTRTGKREEEQLTWEDVNLDIADWIEGGNDNIRQKTAENIQDEKVVAGKLTDLNILNEVLDGEEFLYRAEEGETDIIDWANMESSQRVKDKIYNYFGDLEGELVTDESTVQLMIDNFIKEQTINQSILESKKDDIYFIQKLHDNGMSKEKIYANWKDDEVELMNDDA